MEKKGKIKKGRANKYETIIKPNFDVIKEFLKMGYEEKRIYETLGVSKTTWHKFKKEKTDFANLFIIQEEDKEEIRAKLLEKNGSFIMDILNDTRVDPAVKLRYLTYYESTRLGMMTEKEKQYHEIRKAELQIKRDMLEKGMVDNEIKITINGLENKEEHDKEGNKERTKGTTGSGKA